MAYKSTLLKREVSVRKIISIHYFQYMSDFVFPGESHDFWELVCVDRGEIEAVAGSRRISLKRGDILFHPPGEFHNVITNGKISPSLVVIGFACSSRCLDGFGGRVMTVQAGEKELLAKIILEAPGAFDGPLGDPYQEELIPAKCPPFGAGQLIGRYLEELIICLYRRYFVAPAQDIPEPFWPEEGEGNEASRRILRYLQERVGERLTVERIARDNLMGVSQLEKLLGKSWGCGAIELFSRIKIDAAKQLIRDGQLNMTQIAERLGYSSLYYFSRQFKKAAAMSPSEYAASIRILSEKKPRTDDAENRENFT